VVIPEHPAYPDYQKKWSGGRRSVRASTKNRNTKS